MSEMQTAVQDAQSRFASDLKHERKVAAKERESLIADYQKQVEETRKNDLLAAELQRSLDEAERKVGTDTEHNWNFLRIVVITLQE